MARILVLALALVLGLLGVTVYKEVSDYGEAGDTVRAVSLALTVQDLIHEAQRERGLSTGLLGGDNRQQQPVVEQRGRVDHAIEVLRGALGENGPGAGQVRAALNQFNALPGTRAEIDARRITKQGAFQFYTDAIQALTHLQLGLDQARDSQVRHGLEALYALGRAKEESAQERGFLNGVFAAEGFNGAEYMQFLEIRAGKLSALASFTQYATKTQQAKLDASLLTDNATKAEQAENIAIASSEGRLVHEVDPISWWSQISSIIDDQRNVQQAIGNEVQTSADDLQTAAARNLFLFLFGAAVAIAAMVALVISSVRGIVRPLAGLAAEADDVASRRLPEVIDAWLKSSDNHPDPPARVRTPAGATVEIEAVAGALDNVQTTAFELASQQALVRRNTTESMANLARRNQNLVRRQLSLISEFEREELDPKGLANLFELDHLATRMRRNAESLLVLTGEGSPRRWADPIPLTDVIRAGLSEVDDYRRVALRRVDDIAVQGAVVSELAHMLAELIENGLAFSPPDLEVEIYGRKVQGGYLLAVVDHGVGMPPEQLAVANARLRGEQDFIVSPSRYLGHYVVGRLAQRLGVEVELNVSPVSGIVARVFMPTEVLASEQDPLAAAPRAALAAPAPEPPPALPAAERRPAHARHELAPAEGALLVRDAPTRNGVEHESAHPAHALGATTQAVRTDVASDARTDTERDARYDTGVASRIVEAESPVPSPPASAYSHFVSPVDPPTGATPVLPNDTGQWRLPEASAATERTRNGLVKRNKRSRDPEPGAPRSDSARAEFRPAAPRTPNDVRSMLSSFRAGHERGAGAPEIDPRAEDSAQNWPEP
ncbi:sensor histidine kinase [Nocardia panacis]|uniref:sensor histidine kinase n=1 Tax=Nocardia panacis TaxID=2340916 RepID=UPI001EF1121C|nr:ATP-binding protein [Nocardia panacis]